MKIQFRCIASGSNGNCAYISTPEGVLLVDAGISTRRILNALSEDKIRSKDILGICVSHAHSDHIMGLPVLSTRLKVPVLCSTETKTILQRFNRYDRRWNAIAQHSINFDFNKAFFIGPFTIKMIKTIHDVEGSTSFQIGYNDEFITTLTDTGQLLSHHIKSMAESFLVLLEMNHDIPSLIASRRP
ncbi:MAG: MBL fold metallo-hydrolase, partial [Candidatus Heimdallarchaeota archaeon]|nr:MBL fold metallo-hydrolase [Candidatus Heimdallarchaeota archaeon]